MGYGAVIKDIHDKLINLVKGCESFSSSTVTGAFIKDFTGVTYPVAMIRPIRDRFSGVNIADGLYESVATFRIRIVHKGTGTKSDVDRVYSLTGEVVDAIESNRNLGSSSAHVIAKVDTIDYSQSEQPSGIFYYSVIMVDVRYLRS